MNHPSSSRRSNSSSSPPHQYPEAIQLKLYQAFIFSIPILFSIILFLLFYLFYLKRRSSANNNSTLLPRTTTSSATSMLHSADLDLKNNEVDMNKLCQILMFDDSTETVDSLCCVCLGEFEMKEELLQVRSCKHMFHVDCIRHWLYNHSTCPLCRAPVHVNVHQAPMPMPMPMHHHHHITTISPQQSTSTTSAT